MADNLPEVCPQINDLPCSQSNQHPHGSEAKPLDSGVRALIRVSQLLFSAPEVFHLRNDFGDQLFNASEFCLNRLELLSGLDSRPIFGVCANVNVEFDMACRISGVVGCPKLVTEINLRGGVTYCHSINSRSKHQMLNPHVM